MLATTEKKIETFEGKRFPFRMSVQQNRRDLVSVHWHEHIELIKIIRGPVFVQIDQISFQAETDDILFINSCQLHAVRSLAQDCAILGMVFDKALLFSPEKLEIRHLLSLFLRSNQVAARYGKSHPLWPELQSEMEKAYEEYNRAEIGYEYSILACIYRIMLPILRLHRQDLNHIPPHLYTTQYMRLKPAIAYMEANLAEKVYMEEVGKNVGMSVHSFSTLFKKVFGIPPVQYLTQLRIHRAKQLLVHDELSVSEIAEQCGFCNINYFDKVFKEKSGFTPMDFRKRHVDPDQSTPH